jgi:hypothetical protein
LLVHRHPRPGIIEFWSKPTERTVSADGVDLLFQRLNASFDASTLSAERLLAEGAIAKGIFQLDE